MSRYGRRWGGAPTRRATNLVVRPMVLLINPTRTQFMLLPGPGRERILACRARRVARQWAAHNRRDFGTIDIGLSEQDS